MTKPEGKITEFGFQWGQVKVTRAWSHNGHLGLMIHTGKKLLDIRITPTGLIRVGDVQKDYLSD